MIRGEYQIAKRALGNLILGSPTSKVYGTFRTVAARASERFVSGFILNLIIIFLINACFLDEKEVNIIDKVPTL